MMRTSANYINLFKYIADIDLNHRWWFLLNSSSLTAKLYNEIKFVISELQC